MNIDNLSSALKNNVAFILGSKKISSATQLNLAIPELIKKGTHSNKCNCPFCMNYTGHRMCREVYLNIKANRLELYEDDDQEVLTVTEIINILDKIKKNHPNLKVWIPDCRKKDTLAVVAKASIRFNTIYEKYEVKLDVV